MVIDIYVSLEVECSLSGIVASFSNISEVSLPSKNLNLRILVHD